MNSSKDDPTKLKTSIDLETLAEALTDPILQKIILDWKLITPAIRKAIEALVDAASDKT